MVTKVGYQTNKRKFATIIKEIGKRHTSALNYVTNIPKEQWGRAYDGGYRHGFMTTKHSVVSANLPIRF